MPATGLSGIAYTHTRIENLKSRYTGPEFCTPAGNEAFQHNILEVAVPVMDTGLPLLTRTRSSANLTGFPEQRLIRVLAER